MSRLNTEQQRVYDIIADACRKHRDAGGTFTRKWFERETATGWDKCCPLAALYRATPDKTSYMETCERALGLSNDNVWAILRAYDGDGEWYRDNQYAAVGEALYEEFPS